jgi:hypothetical protein
LASDFEERIVVHLDNGYNIIGIDYQPRNGICHKNIKQVPPLCSSQIVDKKFISYDVDWKEKH